MQIIDAIWERRNLGIDAVEIKITNDDLSDISATMMRINSPEFAGKYVTVKVPVGNLDIVHTLEDAGFRFMENQFHAEKSLNNYETPKLIRQMRNPLTQHEIPHDADAWRAVVDLMTDNMFYTDRIYLDNAFPRGTSRTRYQNWTMDLVHDPNAHLFVYKFKDTPVGFGLVKMNPDTHVIDDLLEGVFEAYQDTGFGVMIFDLALRSYQQRGMTKLITSISSNNTSIVSLDLMFGYTITSQEYVFRKFYNGEK